MVELFLMNRTRLFYVTIVIVVIEMQMHIFLALAMPLNSQSYKDKVFNYQLH